MKVLLVKTSSLGDLIHTMPAVSDLAEKHPNVELHWLVEEGFCGIPLWHPFIKKVHSCAVRRWRKSLFSKNTRSEIKSLKQALLAEDYDVVLDAQGLIKTALMVRWLPGEKVGLNKHSIKEPIASRAYDRAIAVAKGQNAIVRVKQLFASTFNYSQTDSIHFGMQVEKPIEYSLETPSPYVVCLHGTNWVSKIWPQEYWITLAQKLITQGYQVFFPFGDDIEKQRAQLICGKSGATLLPKCSLDDLAYLIQHADAVVGSDTGLSHIAAALSVPIVGLYGSTNSVLTGLVGDRVASLQSSKACSPCMKRECPLVKSGEIIPCYHSIGVEEVLKTLMEVQSAR